jgi:hypothetical protein
MGIGWTTHLLVTAGDIRLARANRVQNRPGPTDSVAVRLRVANVSSSRIRSKDFSLPMADKG